MSCFRPLLVSLPKGVYCLHQKESSLSGEQDVKMKQALIVLFQTSPMQDGHGAHSGCAWGSVGCSPLRGLFGLYPHSSSRETPIAFLPSCTNKTWKPLFCFVFLFFFCRKQSQKLSICGVYVEALRMWVKWSWAAVGVIWAKETWPHIIADSSSKVRAHTHPPTHPLTHTIHSDLL